MLLQEGQRPTACKSRCSGVVAGAHIAVEAVSGVLVPVNFDLRVRGVDLLYLLCRDVLVKSPEV